MAKTLLLGRAGSGKTRALMEAVADAIRNGVDDRALLLVPTYGRGEHLKRALLTLLGSDPPGYLDRSVVTFTSLAERVLGATPIGALAPAALRDRLLRRALREAGGDAFARVREFPGFRARFLALVKEVKESALEPGEAEAALDDLAAALPGRAARRRMEGFARAFRAYGVLLAAEGRLDHEDFQAEMLRRLRQGGGRLPAAIASVRWMGVDGFTDFTALQLEVIDRLAALVPEAVLTLPFDEGRAPLFAPSAETRERFRAWTPRPLRSVLRARAGSDLARLEAGLFSGEVVPREPDGSVTILECADPADEADRIARTAGVWMRRDGFAAREILVVHRDLAAARPLLEEAFARHGVPLSAFAARPLAAEPIVREALGLVRAALEAADAEAPPAAFRDLVLAALAVPDHLRPSFAEPDPDPARGAAEAAALGVLLHLVAETASLLARESEGPVPPGRFLEDFERAVAGASFQPRDRRLHAVSAVDAEEARQWEARGVLLAGLNEKVFPRPPREDLFLRDADRSRARQAGGAPRARLRLSLHLDRRDGERLLFYTACTRARERLVLAWPAAGTGGERRLRSSFLDEAERIWPGGKAPRSVSTMADPAPVPGEELHRADLLRGALLRAREPAVPGGEAHGRMVRAGAVLDALAARSKRGSDPDLARAAALAADPVPRIPGRTGVFRTSASALAAHGQCRYLHFARHVLRLEAPERKEDEGLDPLRLGTAAHRALERWFRGGRRGDPAALFDEALAEEMEGVRAGLADRVLARRGREAVAAFAAFEGARVDGRSLRPAGEEVSFGMGGKYPPLVLRAGGRRIEVRGQFDRVDADPAGRAVVVDYKMSFAGRKYGEREHEAAFADGDPQVAIYLAAIRDAARLEPLGVEIADIAARRVTGIRVEGAGPEVAPDPKSVVVEAAGIDGVVRALALRAGRAAAALGKGDVTPRPTDPARCGAGNCEYADLCRFEKGRMTGEPR